MTEQQPQPAAGTDHEAMRIAAARYLTSYGTLMEPVPKWQAYKFHRDLGRALEWVERTPDARLIVQGPPRVGKTVEASQLFPAWFLGKHPDKDVMAVTYAGGRAEDIGRRVRQLISNPRHARTFPKSTVLEQYSAATRIDMQAGGRYTGVSFSGTATGRGADLLCVDDPNKGPEDARSALWQQLVREQWRFIFRPRVNSGGRILVSMARYGVDDFVGWLLSLDEEWRVLSYPMVNADGEPLVPELFDREACARIENEVGSRSWSSLYLQDPLPDDAAVFQRNWWNFYGGAHDEPLPVKFDDVITMWDCKLKNLATKGSYVVGQAWGRKGGKLYLLAQLRARWSFAETLRKMVELDKAHPDASALCIEDAAAGPTAMQVLKEKFSHVVAVSAGKSKLARAEAVAPMVESGSVFLPRAPWVDEYIDEHQKFPQGAHDDQVDCTSHALARLGKATRGEDDFVAPIFEDFTQTNAFGG